MSEPGPTSSASPVTASGERVRELEALHLASDYLHRLRDPAVLASNVVTLLKDVVHHDYAAVYVVDDDRLRTFAVSDRGLGPGILEADFAYLESLDLEVGKNVTGWVARHGETVRLDDVSADPRYLDSQEGIQSELCVPMRSGDAVIGVVNLESTRAAAYDEADRRVLEIVANQIAIAIENARLLERMSEMKRLQVLADLTGGVAHDIGNLLVAMALRCDALRTGSRLTDAQEKELVAIGAAVERSITLAQSLMQIGIPKPSTGDAMRLNEHLRGTAPVMEMLGGDRLHVTFALCAGELQIAASPGQLDQILINLVVNARAAVDESGQLIIRTRREQRDDGSSGVCLDVEDDGCGMSPAVRAAAMQPLYTTREGGSGLGLATVARLVGELGGSINLRSEQSVGTLVSITLPVLEDNSGLTAVDDAVT